MKKRLLVGLGLSAILVLGLSGVAFAQDTSLPTIDPTVQGLNLVWIVVSAVLVIFMQAGFALVETGFCRAKHAAHVVSTNFAIFGLGFVAYFCVGYAFMFGGYSFPNLFGYDKPIGSALLGSGNHVLLWKGGFFLGGNHAYHLSVFAFFHYMVAVMDPSATIPTGAMAER